jgi:hypothetical protein
MRCSYVLQWVLLILRVIPPPVNLRVMARVLDDRQPLVLTLNPDSSGLGGGLALKSLVRPEIVVEDLEAAKDTPPACVRNTASSSRLTWQSEAK